MDRKVRKDAYYVYKAYWSKEPFVYITGRRYAERPYDTMTVKVYSNQPEVTLRVNNGEAITMKGDKVFLFEDVKLNETINFVTASADGCKSDTVTWVRTKDPNPCYVKPQEEEDDRDGVKNWFDEVDDEATLPELSFKEGFYSVKDTVADILQHEEAGTILVDAINKYGSMKVKKSMMGIMSGIPVEDMMGMVSSNKETAEIILKRANAALQKIAKNTDQL